MLDLHLGFGNSWIVRLSRVQSAVSGPPPTNRPIVTFEGRIGYIRELTGAGLLELS